MKICFGFVVKMELAVETEEERFRHICSSVCHSSPPHFAETTIKLFACATMSAFWFSCPFYVWTQDQQSGFQYHGCLDFANHTLPGNFKIKSQWHFYQLLCLKTTIFKHRFQKRQYFDLLSRQRQASVPLVLFSASLWDQLSKILNRDLFFHNLLVFLHHSQLLTNLRAKRCQKIADLLVEIAQTPMSEFANLQFIKNCWFLRFEMK